MKFTFGDGNKREYVYTAVQRFVCNFYFFLKEVSLKSKMLICCSGNKPDYHVEKGCAA